MHVRKYYSIVDDAFIKKYFSWSDLTKKKMHFKNKINPVGVDFQYLDYFLWNIEKYTRFSAPKRVKLLEGKIGKPSNQQAYNNYFRNTRFYNSYIQKQHSYLMPLIKDNSSSATSAQSDTFPTSAEV